MRAADVIGLPFWDTPWWVSPASQACLRAAIARASRGELARCEVTHVNDVRAGNSVQGSLSKPFTTQELLTVLQRVIQKSKGENEIC